MNKVKVGTIVKSKRELKDRYYDYPKGYNLNIFPSGTLFKVISTPYKVCMVKGDGFDEKDRFLNLVPLTAGDNREIVVSTDYCNVRFVSYTED